VTGSETPAVKPKDRACRPGNPGNVGQDGDENGVRSNAKDPEAGLAFAAVMATTMTFAGGGA